MGVGEMVRRRYGRYQNVQMGADATLIKLDYAIVKKNIANNAFAYWHYYEIALSENKPDLYVKFIGSDPIFVVFSTKALAELKKLTPEKFDRDDVFLNKIVGKIFS